MNESDKKKPLDENWKVVNLGCDKGRAADMQLVAMASSSLNEQSFSELPSSAQLESMRETQPFSEAALSE
ncbi:hypothetical protein Tco_1316979 [Tanacetum coccineum]